MPEKKPTPETLAMCREYVTGRASARRQTLWDRTGEWNPQRRDDGSLIRPQEYWTPIVVIGKQRKGVVGPNEDGSSGAPVGYYTRKEAVANAQRFIDKCRELLAEAGE